MMLLTFLVDQDHGWVEITADRIRQWDEQMARYTGSPEEGCGPVKKMGRRDVEIEWRIERLLFRNLARHRGSPRRTRGTLSG